MKIEYASHLGLIRENNEDRFLVKLISESIALLAVADGMGGHAGGEVAASLAIETLDSLPLGERDTEAGFSDVLEEVQQTVTEVSRIDDSLRGMGTTLTLVLIDGLNAHWAHVGDSRLYLLRAGKLARVTNDHTVPGELLKRGEISHEKARLHPFAHMLVQCIGCRDFRPDTGSFRLQAGDLLLLSTDGLHDLLPESTISSILNLRIGIREKLERMFRRCLEAGGRDNITAILAEIES